jgi:hypothetical protein
LVFGGGVVVVFGFVFLLVLGRFFGVVSFSWLVGFGFVFSGCLWLVMVFIFCVVLQGNTFFCPFFLFHFCPFFVCRWQSVCFY